MFRWTALALGLVLTSAPASASGPWVVYFEFDRASLTSENELILEQAAEWLLDRGVQTLIVEAGADRAGPQSYNLELSRRRALAIRSALVRRGFREDKIELRVLGESRPLIQTLDGVAARDNRYGMFSPKGWRAQ
jgi:outer membrane protein OmpA-like peptidoglycan-associated protein